MVLEHKLNTNLGLSQTGSKGAPKASMILGAVDGQPTEHKYEDMRYALSVGKNRFGFFDDFLGDALLTNWQANAGSTGTNAPVLDQVGGVVALTTAATLSDHVTLALGTHFRASDGWLFFDARVTLPALTLIAVEVGLSDAVSETAGLAFSNHTVAGVVDVATNAVVFAFDSAGDVNWNINTVKEGTPQAVNTGVLPIVSVYNNLSIRVSPEGRAFFYIDDTLVGNVANAITPTIALTPWVTVVARVAGAKVIRIDYIGATGSR